MSLPASDDQLLLLHNPRCSKSRAALALLEERGAEVEVRSYLESPLTREELIELGARLARPVGDWTRRREKAFAEAGLDDRSDDAAILAAMEAHPILMERPVLVRGRRAVIGRPPEAILALL